MSDKKLTIAYWKIRGLAAPIRALLTFLELDFENKMYEQHGAPDFSRHEWLDVKESVGLAFPNLPYLIDGELRLTQSRAILCHLARKYGADKLTTGTSLDEQAQIDMVLNVCGDFSSNITRTCYSPDFDALLEQFRDETLPTWARRFAAFLGDGKKFLMGDKPCVADFTLWELLDQSKKMVGDEKFAEHKRVAKFHADFAPLIKKYVDSDMHKLPCNNTIAKFR